MSKELLDIIQRLYVEFGSLHIEVICIMILNKKRFAEYESCHKVSLFSIIKHHKVFIETMCVLRIERRNFI